MKTKLIVAAAAAALSLGAAGAVNAAPVAGKAAVAPANGAVKQVTYGYGYGPGPRYGFNHRRCKRLHYRGFVLGHPFARHLFRKHCTYRRYSYGINCKALYKRAYVYDNPHARLKYDRYCINR